MENLRAGELEREAKKQKLFDAYAEELSAKRLEWQNIQALFRADGRETRKF
jgi:hypothetical protein